MSCRFIREGFMAVKTLQVAAIQPVCRPGSVADNLAHLEELIGEAATHGAELALLPECFPEAFQFDDPAWLAASPANGKLTTWLTEMSRKYRLYLAVVFWKSGATIFSIPLSSPVRMKESSVVPARTTPARWRPTLSRRSPARR
jgi:predicted amidohydrolase